MNFKAIFVIFRDLGATVDSQPSPRARTWPLMTRINERGVRLVKRTLWIAAPLAIAMAAAPLAHGESLTSLAAPLLG